MYALHYVRIYNVMYVQTMIAEIERGIIKSCKLKSEHSANENVHELPELNGNV